MIKVICACKIVLNNTSSMIAKQYRCCVTVVGILDIAKCLYEAIVKLEHAYQKSSDRLEVTVKKVFSCFAVDNVKDMF